MGCVLILGTKARQSPGQGQGRIESSVFGDVRAGLPASKNGQYASKGATYQNNPYG